MQLDPPAPGSHARRRLRGVLVWSGLTLLAAVALALAMVIASLALELGSQPAPATVRSPPATASSTTSWTTGVSGDPASWRVSAWSFPWSFRRAPRDMTGPHQLDDAPDLNSPDDAKQHGVDDPGSTSNP